MSLIRREGFGLIVVAKGGAFIDKMYCICCRTPFRQTWNGLKYLFSTIKRVQSFLVIEFEHPIFEQTDIEQRFDPITHVT